MYYGLIIPPHTQPLKKHPSLWSTAQTPCSWSRSTRPLGDVRIFLKKVCSLISFTNPVYVTGYENYFNIPNF